MAKKSKGGYLGDIPNAPHAEPGYVAVWDREARKWEVKDMREVYKPAPSQPVGVPEGYDLRFDTYLHEWVVELAPPAKPNLFRGPDGTIQSSAEPGTEPFSLSDV